MRYRSLLGGLICLPLVWSPASGQNWAEKLGAKSRDAAAAMGSAASKAKAGWDASRSQREAAADRAKAAAAYAAQQAAERARATAATQGPRVLKYTKDMATAGAQNWTANRPQREAALREARDQARDAARRAGAGVSAGARGTAAAARDAKKGWVQRSRELDQRNPRPHR